MPNWSSADTRTMRRKLPSAHWILPALLLFLLPGKGRGGNDLWNVRMAPSPGAPVVASIREGTALQILSRAGDWYEIPAPADAEVWVASCFLDGKGRLKDGARFRSGPGVIYPEYRYVPSSREPVWIVERERAYEGGWRRILPPPGLRCYIHKKFTGENPLPPKKNPLPAKKTELPKSKTHREQHSITVEGMPVRLKRKVEDAEHELILEINGKQIPICYLGSAHLNLNLWENRMVRIIGRFRWQKGINRPFLEIEKVSPSWK